MSSFPTGQCPNQPQGETRDDDDSRTPIARQRALPVNWAAPKKSLRITIERALGSADDTETVMRATLDTLTPAARETFVLNKVRGQATPRLRAARAGFQWVVRRRMLAAIRRIAQGPHTASKYGYACRCQQRPGPAHHFA